MKARWHGVRAQLDKAAKDRAVKAVVLRIHSPGGTATASEIIYGEIQRFKAKKSVPVVAQLMGIATSGAYYAAMAADSVYANPTTVTGSIVIFVSVNVSGLMAKLGLADQTITTGPYKDTGSPLRPMTPEDRALMQGVLNDLYRRFVQVVVAGRPNLPASRVVELADGRSTAPHRRRPTDWSTASPTSPAPSTRSAAAPALRKCAWWPTIAGENGARTSIPSRQAWKRSRPSPQHFWTCCTRRRLRTYGGRASTEWWRPARREREGNVTFHDMLTLSGSWLPLLLAHMTERWLAAMSPTTARWSSNASVANFHREVDQAAGHALFD